MSKEEKEPDFKIFTLVQKDPNAKEIPIDKIREITSRTLDEAEPEDRAVAWLVLTEVFPKNPNDWDKEKQTLINDYWEFVEAYKISHWYEENVPDAVNQKQLNVEDADKPLMAQIHSDIVRTGRQIQFFPPLSRQGNPDDTVMYMHTGFMRRIERILFVFAKNNKALSYTQGFNELVSPIYYVMLRAKYLFNENMDDIEAITYATLQQLISTSLHDMYTTQDSSKIILTKLDDFTKLLHRHIPNIASRIDKLKIHPATYCYRWYNLLFAQEYDLPNLLPIWDVLFSHMEEILDYAFYLGLGQIKAIEPKLMQGRTSEVLFALQNLEILDPKPVIKYAQMFYDADHQQQTQSIFKKFFNSFKDMM